MKRFLVAFMAGVMLLMGSGSALAAEPVSVYVNGEQLALSTEPEVLSGTVLLPLQPVFEKLGYTVDWDEAAKTVTAVKDGDTLELTVDGKTFLKNGDPIEPDIALENVDGCNFISLDAISKATGLDADWEEGTRTVTIKPADAEDTSLEPIQVYLDGEAYTFDVAPEVLGGSPIIPMRSIFESLGYDVSWVDETKTVIATKGDSVVSMTVDDNSLTKDGNESSVAIAPENIESRTIIPIETISKATGLDAQWDEATRTVTLKTSTGSKAVSAPIRAAAAPASIALYDADGQIFDAENPNEITQSVVRGGYLQGTMVVENLPAGTGVTFASTDPANMPGLCYIGEREGDQIPFAICPVGGAEAEDGSEVFVLNFLNEATNEVLGTVTLEITGSEEEYRALCVPCTYEEITADPVTYDFTNVIMQGKAMAVSYRDDGDVEITMNTIQDADGNWTAGPVAISYKDLHPEQTIQAGDIITSYGAIFVNKDNIDEEAVIVDVEE